MSLPVPQRLLRAHSVPFPMRLPFSMIAPVLYLHHSAVARGVMASETPAFRDLLAPPAPDSLRLCEFNAFMNRENAGEIAAELSTPESEQIQRVAATIQLMDCDVIALMEFDYSENPQQYEDFKNNYLSVPQTKWGSDKAISLPYHYAAVSNTGVLSPYDLDNDGTISIPGDAWGFGFFEGQYASAVFSKFPILEARARTFRLFKWADMPDNRIPPGYYSAEAEAAFRLSSKNHVDLPIDVNGMEVHCLFSHPTPPAFDGPEQRNVRRNADEIRFWADYISPGKADYIYDDSGNYGGIQEGSPFFVTGDLNADPEDGSGIQDAIKGLLGNPLLEDPLPTSPGGAVSSNNPAEHQGDPARDTSFFSIGNLRVDYVLPSVDMPVQKALVFWPAPGDELAVLVNGTTTSDHRAVMVDVAAPESCVDVPFADGDGGYGDVGLDE